MSAEEHAMVPIPVREQSLEYMPSADKQVGALSVLAAQVDHADAEVAMAVVAPVESWRLIPLPKEPALPTEVVWFPFDLHVELVKEIILESGGTEVTWVMLGAPASGNSVLACIELGCSVLSMCENEHHHENLQKTLQNKMARSILAG